MEQYIWGKYCRWCSCACEDEDIKQELDKMRESEEQIEDAFYCDLSFGTGGLRGVIGAGTNRINIYTVAQASQGVANYLIQNSGKKTCRIAISYDSRIKSRLFAEIACGVFAANGIAVYMFRELMPTPCLSYAVRSLQCDAGIMITASHNPVKYNGYKVYGADGCQITTELANAIQEELKRLDIFSDVKSMTFDAGCKLGIIQFIPDSIYTSFIEEVKKQSVLGDAAANKNIAIIYSPLNGTGLKPVLRILKESGYTNVTVVEEQKNPDGNFPTCPSPNPETKETMTLGIEYARRKGADLFLATDPDCDRVGVAVKDAQGEYKLLSGNEVGILLLDYICKRRTETGTIPANPVLIKTIVTTEMAKQIADHYGVRTINVLTGFKFIGEQIGLLEKQGAEESYIFGFEESCGYLSGTYVRDKDAVDGVFLICEMAAYYAAQGRSLYDCLTQLYQTYGYTVNTLYSYEFSGNVGKKKIEEVMRRFHEGVEQFANLQVVRTVDYSCGIDNLPPSNVLQFFLEGNCMVTIRPSGTEPKLKVYISACAPSRKKALATEAQLAHDLETKVK